MTVLMGPTPCRGCRQPVTVVRRPVMIEGVELGTHGRWYPMSVPSTVLREVVPVTSAGVVHRCPR